MSETTTIPSVAVKCRHCGKSKVNRPRGLCWTCYYTPGLRMLSLRQQICPPRHLEHHGRATAAGRADNGAAGDTRKARRIGRTGETQGRPLASDGCPLSWRSASGRSKPHGSMRSKPPKRRPAEGSGSCPSAGFIIREMKIGDIRNVTVVWVKGACERWPGGMFSAISGHFSIRVESGRVCASRPLVSRVRKKWRVGDASLFDGRISPVPSEHRSAS